MKLILADDGRDGQKRSGYTFGARAEPEAGTWRSSRESGWAYLLAIRLALGIRGELYAEPGAAPRSAVHPLQAATRSTQLTPNTHTHKHTFQRPLVHHWRRLGQDGTLHRWAGLVPGACQVLARCVRGSAAQTSGRSETTTKPRC